MFHEASGITFSELQFSLSYFTWRHLIDVSNVWCLLWGISDVQAYGNLLGWSTNGKQSCFIWNVDVLFLSLNHGLKIVYVRHWRFLLNGHNLQNILLYNDKELRPPRKLLSGDEIFALLQDLRQPTSVNGLMRKEKERVLLQKKNLEESKYLFFKFP